MFCSQHNFEVTPRECIHSQLGDNHFVWTWGNQRVNLGRGIIPRHSFTAGDRREAFVSRTHLWVAISECNPNEDYWHTSGTGGADSTLKRLQAFQVVTETLDHALLEVHDQEN